MNTTNTKQGAGERIKRNMKTTWQAARVKRDYRNEYAAVSDYCLAAGYRLSSDPIDGYWLHYGGRMRFVGHLSDVRGWVDYLEREGWQP